MTLVLHSGEILPLFHKPRSLQLSAFYIHAAVFSVYIGEAIGSEKLQISQINSDDSIALNVKVLAAEPSERDLAVAKAQSHATWLSDTLAHRHASKVALLDYDEALWVGGWTLFKRYSLREVFWCEGLSKGCLFIVTALCTSKSTLPLAGILLLGLGLATANGLPFSSTSRNRMGSVFAICLGTTCFTACLEQATQTAMSICVLVAVAGVLPCLFWKLGGTRCSKSKQSKPHINEKEYCIKLEDACLLPPTGFSLNKPAWSGGNSGLGFAP